MDVPAVGGAICALGAKCTTETTSLQATILVIWIGCAITAVAEIQSGPMAYSNARAAKQSGVQKVVGKIGTDASITLALWKKDTPTAWNAESIIHVMFFAIVIIRLNAI
jgi:hypothetical protein